jgi:hypothetical protein
MISTGLPADPESWHDGAMPKRSSPKRDFMEVGRAIVEQAIGEQMDGSPLPEPEPDTRNPHAVALGSMGGRKGGKARAKKLSATKRKAIAKRAARSRWD